MAGQTCAIPAIVLAGERAGGNALARAEGIAAGVLVEIGGMTSIERVVATLRASRSIDGGIIAGPDAQVCEREARLTALFADGDFRWLAPAAGPSASAVAACTQLATYPLLVTAADHALLTPSIVDTFCSAALAHNADFVVGLVEYATVRAAFPASKRTRLRFSDGSYCGANLFLVNSAAGRAVLDFWGALEAQRKRPWRMAALLGPQVLWRYLTHGLSIGDAFALLSRRSGATIGFVTIDAARAAVDVDSSADLELARQVIASD